MRKQLLLAFILAIFSFAASAQYASLDSTFGVNSLAYDSFPGGQTISSIKVLQNDKIVALGFSTTSSGNQFVLARYTANGSLDSTFGTNGWLLDSIPSVTSLTAVTLLLQYDSMLVVTGGFTTVNNGHDTCYLWAMRFKPNGQIDNSFGTAGLAKLSLKGVEGGSNYNPGAGALQPDNKILVGGAVETGTYQGNSFALVRFTANGAVDNTFGTTGRSVITFTIAYQFGSGGDFLTSIVVEPSGRIIAGGYNWNAFNPQGWVAGQFVSELACYKPNGTLDSSFAGIGLLVNGEETGCITALGLQSNGNIVAVGYNNDVDAAAQLFFVDTTGAIPAYTDDYLGVRTLSDYYYTEYYTCYVGTDNKVLAAGFTSAGYVYNAYTGSYDDMLRFQPNGFVDTFFNNWRLTNGDRIGGGWIIQNSPATGVNALGVQSTGRIIAAGSPYFSLVRIFPGADSLDCSDFRVVATGRTYLCTSNPIDTIRASLYNVGINPSYQWYKNGVAVGSNSPTYIVSMANGDSVWVSVTATVNCVGSLVAKSNVMHISVTPPATLTIDTAICHGQYILFGSTPSVYSISGQYRDTAIGANGCDSITTLNLTVRPYLSDTIRASICAGDTFVYGGSRYSTAGLYFNSEVVTSYGCDSFIYVSLKVNGSNDTTYRSICSGGSYNFYGHILTTSGTYRDTLTSALGCDSIKNLILTVGNVIYTGINTLICQGSSYSFHGRNLTIPGLYYDTLTAVGGCDSVIELLLNYINVPTAYLSDTICPDGSYVFKGRTLTVPGNYYDTLTSVVSGCDSLVELTLTVTSLVRRMAIAQTICAGSSYTLGTHTFTAAGTYHDTLTTGGGCDSIVTLTLTVSPALTSSISRTICAGSSYTLGTHTFTTAGTYHDTLTTGGGCDSIVTLTLTVSPALTSSISRTICAGSSYTLGTHTFTTAGTYHDTLTTGGGCDSIVTLTLTVIPNAASGIARQICQGDTFIFGSRHLTGSGTFYDTLGSANGCDSIITLALTMIPLSRDSIYQEECTGSFYIFGGHSLYTSGYYSDTLTAVSGCDSIVTLHLVFAAFLGSSSTAAICQGDSFFFDNRYVTSSGTYNDTLTSAGGCDSIVTLTLSVNPLPQVSLTWDSLVSEHILNGGPWFGGPDTVWCSNYVTSVFAMEGGNPPGGVYTGRNIQNDTAHLTYTGTGLDTVYYTYTAGDGCTGKAENYFTENICDDGIKIISGTNSINLYPNPNNGSFTLETSGNTGNEYTIIDMLGDVVTQKKITSDTETIELPGAGEGVYTLLVKGALPVRFVIVR